MFFIFYPSFVHVYIFNGLNQYFLVMSLLELFSCHVEKTAYTSYFPL